MQAKPPAFTRALVIGYVACAFIPATHANGAQTKPDSVADKMTLEGGQDGTSLPSLTIEGEDRIRIEFERPALNFALDPRSTQGLELGDPVEILDREALDLVHPMLEVSALERTPYLGRAWLETLRIAPVAQFRPELKGVERWRLAIVDSRGQTVREFAGKGAPPEQLEWDGVTASGAPAVPGLTYSYALEAYDRAGNKRNFVGEGFEVRPYRVETSDGLTMLFAGKEVRDISEGRAVAVPPAIVLEVASWINQAGRLDQPIRVQATARSYELAQALSQGIARHLATLVLGDRVRIQPLATVEPDAPEDGTLAVTLAP